MVKISIVCCISLYQIIHLPPTSLPHHPWPARPASTSVASQVALPPSISWPLTVAFHISAVPRCLQWSKSAAHSRPGFPSRSSLPHHSPELAFSNYPGLPQLLLHPWPPLSHPRRF